MSMFQEGVHNLVCRQLGMLALLLACKSLTLCIGGKTA